MNWNNIRAFLAVAETGTLSGAAQKLQVSQPTLGRHIDQLESQTGSTLFIRSRNGMALSPAGLQLVEDARDMAKSADRLSLKAAGRQQSLSGTVRITASDVVATYLLPKILADLRDVETRIDIELVPSNDIQNLLSRDADIAIRMTRPTQNDLITTKVNELQMATWAHKEYLAKFGTPKSIEDMFSHRIIGYDRYDMMLRVMAEKGINIARENFAFRTDNQVAYWELVRAGAGIGFGPVFIGKKDPDMVAIMTRFEITPLPMWLTSHAELKTNARIRRVMDFLGQALRALQL